MPSCIVRGCTYSWKKKDPDIIIHAFPKDLESIRTWLLQTRQDFGDIEEFSRKILEGTKGAYRVCSQHFTADSYETRGFMTMLKKGAVHTIFPDFPINTARYKKAKRRKIDSSLLNYRSVPGVECEPSATAWHPASPIAGGEIYAPGLCMFTAGGRLGSHHNQSHSLYSQHQSTRGQNITEERWKPYGPRPTPRVETSPYTGRIHQSTNTEPFLGTSNKKVQVNRRTKPNSVGIQCNPEDLPRGPERKHYPLRISLRNFDVLLWDDPFRRKPHLDPKALDLV